MAFMTIAAARPWLPFHSEAGQRIRDHDWSTTPLGLLDQWPIALRQAVRMILDHPLPMAVGWTRDYITIYNDAYREMLRGKPEALGLPLLEVWSETSETAAPLFDDVFAGLSHRFTDARFMVLRGGQAEEAFFNYSLSPLRDDAGDVQGILITSFETTAKVHATAKQIGAEKVLRANGERQSLLLQLSDALRIKSDAQEMIEAAARMLGHQLGASRIVFAEFDETNGVANVFFGWFADGAMPFPAVIQLEEYRGAIVEELLAGRTVRIDDIGPPFLQPDHEAIAKLGVKALLSVPVLLRDRMVVNISVHQHTPRHWTDEDAALVKEVVERLWANLVRFRAERALRDSQDLHHFLLSLSDTLGRLVDVADIAEIAVHRLCDRLDVNRVRYGEIEGDTMNVRHECVRGVPPAPRALSLAPFGSAFLERYRAGALIQVNDVAAETRLPEMGRTALKDMQVAAFCDVVLFEEEKRTGLLVVQSATPRNWTSLEVELIRNSAERIRSALKRAQAEAALREGEERFRQFGEASQDVIWIRDAETLQWQYLTPAFEKIYGLDWAEALAGDNYHSWLDLIVPEDRQLASEMTRRVRHGESVAFEYRIRRPIDGTIRWLRNTDFPITDAEGNVRLIGGISHDLTQLRNAQSRLEEVVENIPQLVWRADDPGRWTWASPQWTKFTGQTEEDSRDWGWLDPIHPDDRAPARAAWARAEAEGQFTAEYRIREKSTGSYRWFQTRATPLRDEHDVIREWFGTSTDIDDIRRLQGRQQVLVEELQHRTFNLMGMVRSTADRTIRSSVNLPDFRAKFRNRIDALARVQRLLSRLEDDGRVTFADLIHAELDAIGFTQAGEQRVTLDGPDDVPLRSSTVQIFAMALHELTTNAVKYGALRQGGGHLHVRWWVEADEQQQRWLHVDWHESGVTMPQEGAAPTGTGQGRALIEKALPYQLHAKTTYVMAADGVRCSIALPISNRGQAETHDAAHQSPDPRG
jgi:PAS domain S-box-containing protein